MSDYKVWGRGLEPDRFIPHSVDPSMVMFNTGHSPFSTKRDYGNCDGAWKCIVRSPQRILTFPPNQTTARRDPLNGDIAPEASAQEAGFLKELAADDRLLEEPTRRPLFDVSCASQNRRTIPRSPFIGIAVPGIVDDFYMDLVAWGSLNKIAVSLPLGIFLYDVATTKKQALTDRAEAEANKVRCVSWGNGLQKQYLAEGLDSGIIRVRDVESGKIIYPIKKDVGELKEDTVQTLHAARISTCSWSPKGSVLATGSKDNTIAFVDIRSSETPTYAIGHKQEVCGVKWDYDGVLLASGGNDNMLMVWDSRQLSKPLCQFSEHRAAVKAIAWSPHRRGRLVSGGGTADRTLRFWDVNTLSAIGNIDAGSQVCNIAWSSNVDEIVSTHGFSQNHIVVWDTSATTSSSTFIPKPAMPIATLRGHLSRVLYLAVSPDGRTIVTAASDQRMYFWRVFPGRNPSLNDPLCYSSKSKLRYEPQVKHDSFIFQQQIQDDVQNPSMSADCSMAIR